VFEACTQFMERQLEVSNCVGILSFARVHHSDCLYTQAMERIEKNFQQVIA